MENAEKPIEGLDELKDEILKVRGIKEEKQAELKDIEEYLSELELAMLAYFNEHGMKSFKDSDGNNFIMVQTHSSKIYDFGVFKEYVYNTGMLDLLQKRLNQKMVDELLEAGEKIPGIEDVSKLGLRVRKG